VTPGLPHASSVRRNERALTPLRLFTCRYCFVRMEFVQESMVCEQGE
jgi:hypothetical protein